MIIPSHLDCLLSTSWNRQYLYTLGTDILKLRLYQRFSNLALEEGGGRIKILVHDLVSFIKRTLSAELDSEAKSELRRLMYFGANYLKRNIHDRKMKEVVPAGRGTPEFRWFYMLLGYVLQSQPETHLEDVIERIVDIYMRQNTTILLGEPKPEETNDALKLLEEYYDNVPINYEKLFEPRVTPSIRLYYTKDIISLPKLPAIKEKKLLTRSLMHKELCTALLHPKHLFSRSLSAKRVNFLNDDLCMMKNSLSVLDGLGDLAIAQESSILLYKFKLSSNENASLPLGRKTYKLLRIIFGTNTLLAQLAISYNLHQGLNDPLVYKLMRKNYVPHLNMWKNSTFFKGKEDIRKFEQEFIADYFEQYVGALYLEQPHIMKQWISEIYEKILQLVLGILSKKGLLFSYSNTLISNEVIGRPINKSKDRKKE